MCLNVGLELMRAVLLTLSEGILSVPSADFQLHGWEAYVATQARLLAVNADIVALPSRRGWQSATDGFEPQLSKEISIISAPAVRIVCAYTAAYPFLMARSVLENDTNVGS